MFGLHNPNLCTCRHGGHGNEAGVYTQGTHKGNYLPINFMSWIRVRVGSRGQNARLPRHCMQLFAGSKDWKCFPNPSPLSHSKWKFSLKIRPIFQRKHFCAYDKCSTQAISRCSLVFQSSVLCGRVIWLADGENISEIEENQKVLGNGIKLGHYFNCVN